MHRLGRLAPIAWWARNGPAVPLGYAFFEHEIGWHIGQRGRVLPADCFNYGGAIVSDAGTGLPLDRGSCNPAYHCRHGAG